MQWRRPTSQRSHRNVEPERPEAVGVRYDTPLSEHLRGTARSRTLSRESHSLHVEKNRKNIICFRPRANDVSGDANHTTEYRQLQGRAGAPDIIHLCVHTGGRGGWNTPVVGAGGTPRSLLPCAKFTGPRPVTSCNTPTVGSRAGRETTQIRGPVERSNRGASFSCRRVSRLT